jgi:hypothetical protein
VDKWVRLSLIGGLNDEDTKQEVLSRVDEMTLSPSSRPERLAGQLPKPWGVRCQVL